jgi:hypothetical protein
MLRKSTAGISASFRRNPESRKAFIHQTRRFWTPAYAGVTARFSVSCQKADGNQSLAMEQTRQPEGAIYNAAWIPACAGKATGTGVLTPLRSLRRQE